MRELSGAKHIFTMKKTEDGNFMYVVDGSAEDEFSHIAWPAAAGATINVAVDAGGR